MTPSSLPEHDTAPFVHRVKTVRKTVGKTLRDDPLRNASLVDEPAELSRDYSHEKKRGLTADDDNDDDEDGTAPVRKSKGMQSKSLNTKRYTQHKTTSHKKLQQQRQKEEEEYHRSKVHKKNPTSMKTPMMKHSWLTY